jgi:uncharacterized membrane protein
MNDYPDVVAKIVDDYLDRLNLRLRRIPAREQAEFLKEIQSHIFEAYHRSTDQDETERILAVLRKLGEPGEVVSDRLPETMVRSGIRRILPLHVVGGILIALFGVPLGFGGVAVLVGVLSALAGAALGYFAVAAGVLLVSGTLGLLGLVRVYQPALWDVLVARGIIEPPPSELFDALSPSSQAFVMIALACVFAAVGVTMLWLGKYLIRGLRFLFGMVCDWIRQWAQSARQAVRRQLSPRESESGRAALRAVREPLA